MTKQTQTLEIPIAGMDCADCTRHVQHAIEKVPGVSKVDVFLGAEKARIVIDPELLDMQVIRAAVKQAGYSVPQGSPQAGELAGVPFAGNQSGYQGGGSSEGLDGMQGSSQGARALRTPLAAPDFNRRLTRLLVGLFIGVLAVVIVGEWMGVFDFLNERVPFLIGLALVLVGGYPVFLNVLRATLRRQIIAHTLMTLGVLAALMVGEWVTAAIVVLFMRVGDYVEKFTTESARRAVKELSALAPQTARVERDGVEREIPAEHVLVGETVIVRPGEKIPVDGEVIAGQATLDQAAITGEAMPVEAAPGTRVYAASIATLGSLRVRAERAGAQTTFGKVIQLVEEAETNRAEVQRFADKFSAWYLPLVALLAALTYLFSRNPLSSAAVLLVACSCSIALATPVAMLASIGASARRGLLIKGGKYLESLTRADVLLVDKTGTLTLGKPQVVEVALLGEMPRRDAICLAASAERYSEHPLAEALRVLARTEGVELLAPDQFVAIPGQGVSALVDGREVVVGNARLLPAAQGHPQARQLEEQGRTLLFLQVGGVLAAIFAAADVLRPEAPDALRQARGLGIRKIELLTGDNPRSAAALAGQLGVDFRAGLLPEDKIAIVKEYQRQGHVVLMVGDGVNDAPALAQADVGIAMGAAGSDIAVEAAHIALMRDDWSLVPEALRIAQRTMRIVKMNLGFTGLYNVIGLTLAALGYLPPVLAAAAQSLPDIGIMGNSARLIRQK